MPKSFISASATGYYKENTINPQKEDDISGDNFLSYVVQEWEKEINRFNGLGIRTTILRIGLVLSKDGGVLKGYTHYLSYSLECLLELENR